MASLEVDVRRLLGRAIHCYNLIENGDRIAVAVSGGKDSLLLLWLLRERLRRVPIDYRLIALHVDPGFDAQSAARLEDFLRRENFKYEIVYTDHGVRAHGSENRENPCFLCARLRRTTLFQKAEELGCGKIAFGHNQDDLIETFFINICFGGQVSTMLPRQEFFAGKMVVIRPLALIPAAKAARLSRRLRLPIVENCCPSAQQNKRQQIRSLLEELYRDNPKVRGNIFHAMSHVNTAYLPPPLKGFVEAATNATESKEGIHHETDRDFLPD